MTGGLETQVKLLPQKESKALGSKIYCSRRPPHIPFLVYSVLTVSENHRDIILTDGAAPV